MLKRILIACLALVIKRLFKIDNAIICACIDMCVAAATGGPVLLW